MYKKVIKYEDFEGNQKEKTCYFNLSKAELYEKHLASAGKLKDRLQKIYDEQDSEKMVDVFKDFIYLSYGERGEDGDSFVKVKNGHRLAEDFVQTAAYSELFMELSTNPQAARDFVMGVVPKEFVPDGGIPVPTNK